MSRRLQQNQDTAFGLNLGWCFQTCKRFLLWPALLSSWSRGKKKSHNFSFSMEQTPLIPSSLTLELFFGKTRAQEMEMTLFPHLLVNEKGFFLFLWYVFMKNGLFGGILGISAMKDGWTDVYKLLNLQCPKSIKAKEELSTQHLSALGKLWSLSNCRVSWDGKAWAL